jgi:hypothetical protein
MTAFWFTRLRHPLTQITCIKKTGQAKSLARCFLESEDLISCRFLG